MENINVVNSPKGIFSCEINVSVDEWKSILTNPTITTQNYKEALIAFYREEDHKATCKALSLKYYGNAKDAQKFNAWITSFGKAVVKHLNRFHVIDEDGKERFWHVPINPGRSLDNGLFEWTLREELVIAMEALGWNKRCSWIPFYMEMADKLLEYKDNRKELLDIVYSLDKKFTKYIKDENNSHVIDIDPFTVFGIFNRGVTNQNRIDIANYFKEKFQIEAELPHDLDGIPVVNNMMATFYWRENVTTDIQPLWDLFECALQNDYDKLSVCFDKVCKQQGIKWNITMGLFWIRPYDYISLDSTNRDYLPSLKVDVFKDSDIDSVHYLSLLNQVKDKISHNMIEEKNIPEISINAWMKSSKESILDEEDIDMNSNMYQEYINLLKETKNLVLTGAPGTGKTFMAKAIAKEMGAETEFVQFHPSYDYTDFVEGLRPVEKEDGQMGFERKDGVFKEFCKKAADNLEESSKGTTTREKEQNIGEAIADFLAECQENNAQLFTKPDRHTGRDFYVTNITGQHCFISIPSNERANSLRIRLRELRLMLESENTFNSSSDIQEFLNLKWRRQDDTYLFSLYYYIKKRIDDSRNTLIPVNKAVETVLRKNYVFIIDEINRGELSKIFGELFYAIDPGYRGKIGRVKTQYQNLVDDDDMFAEGFYVPENVYILATMNDIDRSVESMDFAMRRRFTWQEVTPNDTESMLDSLSCAEEVKATMKRLNAVIADTDGLGDAFMIGPSYFLKLENNGGNFEKLWKMNIEPLLKEYLRGFRKSKDILKKFEKAYFSNEDLSTDGGIAGLEDEN